MKYITLLTLMLGLLPSVVCAEESFKTQDEKVGYAIGMSIGINLKQQKVSGDPKQVAAGLQAAMQGNETLLSVTEMGQVLRAYQEEVQAEQKKKMAEMAAGAEENLRQAEEFLSSNSQQEGVVTLESGLQYKVLASGSGGSPEATTEVEVHYRGTLIDGTEFDSSYARGKPASFAVNKVIKGWTEALQLMKEGDKWQLAIPPQLAYGESGAPPVVPPNSALIFDVELIQVLD